MSTRVVCANPNACIAAHVCSTSDTLARGAANEKETPSPRRSLPVPHDTGALAPNLALQLEEAVQEGLGGGRAARDVDVDGDDAVAAADDRVRVAAAGAGAGALPLHW